jgi:hypothetical protein
MAVMVGDKAQGTLGQGQVLLPIQAAVEGVQAMVALAQLLKQEQAAAALLLSVTQRI